MNIDINEGLKDPKTKPLFKPIIIVVLIVVIVVVAYLVFNGKHNKIGLHGIETNINDTSRRDTTVINDQSINIQSVGGDVITGDKTVNNGKSIDSVNNKKRAK